MVLGMTSTLQLSLIFVLALLPVNVSAGPLEYINDLFDSCSNKVEMVGRSLTDKMSCSKECCKKHSAFCVVQPHFQWAYSMEVKNNTLILHGQVGMTWRNSDGSFARHETYKEDFTYPIPNEAARIRWCGGPGVVWGTGHDIYLKENGQWQYID